MTGLLWVVVCVTALLASMAALSAWHDRGKASPEAVRKALHVEMGLIASGAPWLFDESWQVILLACLALIWLRAVRVYRPLGHRFGSALHGVSRSSRGESFFVAAFVITFILAADKPAIYCTAILTMTLADTAAALAGQRLGRCWYGSVDARKSVEGSCAFFFVAFACATSVFVALTSNPPDLVLTAALAVAMVTTALEAVSVDGADNLLVPMGALATLQPLFGDADSAYVALTSVAIVTATLLSGFWPRARGFDA